MVIQHCKSSIPNQVYQIFLKKKSQMTEITKWDFFLKNPTTFYLQETHLKQKEDNMIKSKRLGGVGKGN